MNLRKEAPIQIETDDEDEVSFWKEVASWADNLNARRYSAKRMHDVVLKILEVKPGEEAKFYILQGQLAELYKFSNLSGFVNDKLEEIVNNLNPKDDAQEQQSLVESHGE